MAWCWTNRKRTLRLRPILLKMVDWSMNRHLRYDLLLSPGSAEEANVGERHWRSGRVDGLIVIGMKHDLVAQINRMSRSMPSWSGTHRTPAGIHLGVHRQQKLPGSRRAPDFSAAADRSAEPFGSMHGGNA
jgi:hypothetical protein